MSRVREDGILIAGAGPAGLTAALELCLRGAAAVVFERDHTVGGISRTEVFRGCRVDIGGHRFFSAEPRANRMWEETLGERFLRVRRLSRIHYQGRLFHYPLRIGDVVRGLGPIESLLIGFSFLRSLLFPYRREDNLEEWISNRFGRRLYRTFFKTYTEKVWGMPCTSIRAEWAEQRIQGLSLRTALLHAVLGSRGAGIKTLVDEFRYPELGPGMMWECFRARIEERGGRVCLGHEVRRIRHAGGRVVGLLVAGPDSAERELPARHFLTSMPLAELIERLEPPAPPEVRDAAAGLRYRDFITVCLILDHPCLFPDNWIYVHSPGVRVGRIQNYKNWSRRMVTDENRSCIGMEYFVGEGGDLWRMPDDRLVALAAQELAALGLDCGAVVEGGAVFRQSKAYPVYDETYGARLAVIRRFLSNLTNMQTMGRNGLHKYNNQDHSMMTAVMAVENIFGAKHDLWSYNCDRSFDEAAGRK